MPKQIKRSPYWEKRKRLIRTINAGAVLAQEEARGVPVYKRGNKLIKKLTRQEPRNYIPTTFRGNKKRQCFLGMSQSIPLWNLRR